MPVFSLFNPRSFLALVATRPAQLFWALAVLHLAIWTIVPALTCPNAPLDVIEGYAWGREWLLGTYKHPPMQSWWLQILALATDRAPWVHFLASQIAIITAFWAVWQTGRLMLSETAALVGVMLLEGILYYNFTSIEFNPNVLQLPFWALAGLFFYRGVRKNKIQDWFLLGVWSAGGLYTKYSTMLLLLGFIALMITEPTARKRLKSVGPYLALVTTVLLFLPHIFWLVNHDFLPFTYMLHRMQPDVQLRSIPSYIISPVLLISGQLLALIPVVLLFLVFYGRSAKSDEKRLDHFDRAFLNTATFGPLIVTFILSVIFAFRIRDMWGTPFWNFIGLWAVARFRPSFSAEALTRFVYAWTVIFVAAILLFAGSNILYPYIEQKTARIHFPGKSLATYVTDVWHDKYHAPLRFVVGDTWPAGNVAYYAAERPHVFIFGDKTISPWIKSGDFEKYGGVVVWCVRHCIGQQEAAEDMPAYLNERFPQAEMQPPFTLARMTEADIPPVKMGWAIIPPAKPSKP